MSLTIIRAALENRLAALTPALATSYENAVFTPVNDVPYQRVSLLPANPDNSMAGSKTYLEVGIFQVTLCYPIKAGTAAASTKAEAVRTHFKRGTSLVESGLTVLITNTPRLSPAMVEGGRYCIAVSVTYQTQIST